MATDTRAKNELAVAESKYELIEYKGKAARRYPNGVIRDERGSRILHLPHNIALAIKHGQKDIARLAAIEGMNEATGKDDYYESVKELFKTRTKMAMNDTTRAGNEALRLILEHTGLGQDKMTTTNIQGVVQHVPVMSDSYWQAMKELQEGEIIEAENEPE
jgi:hypothetical protein